MFHDERGCYPVGSVIHGHVLGLVPEATLASEDREQVDHFRIETILKAYIVMVAGAGIVWMLLLRNADNYFKLAGLAMLSAGFLLDVFAS